MAQVGGVCFDTDALALSAVAAQNIGAIVPGSADSSVIVAAAPAASSVTYTLQPFSGGAPFAVVADYSAGFPPCSLPDTAEAVELGWAVIAAWAATWAIRFLTEQIRT